MRLVLASHALINVIRKCAVARLSLACSTILGCVRIYSIPPLWISEVGCSTYPTYHLFPAPWRYPCTVQHCKLSCRLCVQWKHLRCTSTARSPSWLMVGGVEGGTHQTKHGEQVPVIQRLSDLATISLTNSWLPLKSLSQWESDSKTLMHENLILCKANTDPCLTDKSQNWLLLQPTAAYRNTKSTNGLFPCLVLNASLPGDFQVFLAPVGGEAGHSHCSHRNGNFKTLWNNQCNSHQWVAYFPDMPQ